MLIARTAAAAVIFAACVETSAARELAREQVRTVVDAAVRRVMSQFGVPGMAVGVVVGPQTYVLDYGVASTQTRKPVTRTTLFEIGSISKTFTATLASYAQVTGRLSLSDPTRRWLPNLQGRPFGDVTLLELGTHTPGGLPVQVPEELANQDELMRYFEQWQPTYVPGTYRTYANAGIGMLGVITAKSMNQGFVPLMEQHLFPMLGMTSTYIEVPESRRADYAQGYRRDGSPIRMNAGLLSAEAYGVKTTATDMVRYLQAGMSMISLDATLQRAIFDTHTGYFSAGIMTQDLIWEQYPYPVALTALLEGNELATSSEATRVVEIVPPQPPRDDVWINKTGSTNGFAAYVAFVPSERIGIVMLANRNYPIEDRVTIAHRIVTRLISERQRGH